MIEALRAALSMPTNDGFTVNELCAQAGLSLTKGSKDKVRAFLKSELASGRVQSRMGRRPGIGGYPIAVPIYVPVTP